MVLRTLSVIVTFLLALTITLEILAEDTKPDVGLWLARSCVGEAGFASATSGECAAIMHIYRKRARLTRKTTYHIARKYSAAIKRRYRHPNPWVLYLNRDLTQPKHWNRRLSWGAHKDRWVTVLDLADRFVIGKVKDPTPSALHYGGWMDRYHLCPKTWKRIRNLPFANYFYTRKGEVLTNLGG